MTDKQKLEDKIMNEIKSDKLKPRSKYIFLAEKLGVGSAFVFSLVLAILFFNLFLFYLKASDNLEYLNFGGAGLLAFLESFPYLLVISFILFLFLAGYLTTKSDISYKKPFGYLMIALVLFVIVSGGILAYTDISERIEEGVYNPDSASSLLKPFLGGCLENRGSGIAGIIFEVEENYLIIQTPTGLQGISLEEATLPPSQKFVVGQFIVAVGERKDKGFLAQKVRILDEDESPMVRRGIHRHFENKEGKGCMRECEHAEECFKECAGH